MCHSRKYIKNNFSISKAHEGRILDMSSYAYHMQNTKMRDKAPCMFPTLTWYTTLQSRLPHYQIIYTSDGLSEGSRQICDWFES